MGKHGATRTTRTGHGARTPRPHTAHAAPAPVTPSALRQTAAFGALAVLVAVVALTWVGANARTALTVGLGLLVLGAVAFLLLRRTGLLADRDPSEAPDRSAAHP